MEEKLKVLVMLPRVPYPLKDGGAIAMYNLLRGMYLQNTELTILSYNTIKHFADPIPKEVADLGDLHTVFIDNRIKPLDALINLFTTASYHISRFQTDEVEEKLSEILQTKKFDIIHCDSLYTGIYLPVIKQFAPKSKVVLRQHNIEYQIWERIAIRAKGLKKWYLSVLSERLKKVEYSLIPQFDAIIPITPIDALTFTKMGAKQQYVCPVGVNMEQYSLDDKVEENTVFHLGSLDWMPNLEGMKWFLEKVWPIVHAQSTKATFHIAGRNVPDWILNYNGKQNIVVDGEIPSAPQYLKSKQIMVVPLKSGSGMRVKIIEGFAAGKAIVSTTIGAEGIACEDNVHIEIADTEIEFANNIVNLLNNSDKTSFLGSNAKELIREKYSDIATAKGLVDFYRNM